MAYKQVDPVPKTVQFVVRVDSDKHAELANWVWHLPFGRRNAKIVELLLAGLTATGQATHSPVPRERTSEPAPPAPAQDATATNRAPAASSGPEAPATSALAPASISFDLPPVQAPTASAADAEGSPDDADGSGVVGSLLNQFG